jgi:hypothetical protein
MISAVTVTASGTFADDAFQRTWQRTDLAVVENVEARTWMWGPAPITEGFHEWYIEAPEEWRLVQYFDKSRMEITNPSGNTSSDWYVTNGLLATEMITGRMQFGDSYHVQFEPAQVPVAGDTDDHYGPTYATFRDKTYVPLDFPGVVVRRINRAGMVWDDPRMAVHGVDTPVYVADTNHRIASVFWDFMNQDGPIYRDGGYMLWPLFENPFYATGLPITEAYWSEVKVGGVYRDVLMQCFERRCLTYTPGNPPGFEVEAGNVGLHYFIWRYGE